MLEKCCTYFTVQAFQDTAKVNNEDILCSVMHFAYGRVFFVRKTLRYNDYIVDCSVFILIVIFAKDF